VAGWLAGCAAMLRVTRTVVCTQLLPHGCAPISEMIAQAHLEMGEFFDAVQVGKAAHSCAAPMTVVTTRGAARCMAVRDAGLRRRVLVLCVAGGDECCRDLTELVHCLAHAGSCAAELRGAVDGSRDTAAGAVSARTLLHALMCTDTCRCTGAHRRGRRHSD
jgi:hypothetical protein